VPALLAHGADPSLRDANGRTAADWAKLKGHTEIVALLSHTGCPVQVSKAIAGTQAGPEPAATVTANSALWFTGIKAVDLFAPLAKGALVRVDGGAMVGRNVAIGEMCAAALRDGVPCVWGLLQDSGWQAEAVAELLAETGLEGRVEVVSAHGAAAADTDAQAGWADRVVDRAEALLAAGAGHVLVTFFDEAGHRAELEAVLPRLGATGGGFITCLLVTRWQAFDGQANALKLPFDAVLAFDLGLALVHHFPAIHPLHTGSRCLGDSALDVEHIDLAKRAQALLAAYRDGLPSLTPQDLEQLDVRKREAFAGCRVPIPNFQPEPTGRVAHSLDGLQQARAQRLMAFLTQPFHQTEFASGQPGASVGRGDLLRGVRAILNGECDQLAPGALLYRGVLPT
jgi:F-type H+-transporting ATPase subunit beta